jgi:hypothetical protein
MLDLPDDKAGMRRTNGARGIDQHVGESVGGYCCGYWYYFSLHHFTLQNEQCSLLLRIAKNG